MGFLWQLQHVIISSLLNVLCLRFVCKAGRCYAWTPNTIPCWRRHWFSGTWPLKGNVKQESSSLVVSALGDQLFTTRGNLRDSYVFTITRPKWWKEKWSSRVRRWCSPTPFNKRHLFGSKRERKVANGTGVISSWADWTIMQCKNILYYIGSRAKLHHCEFYILNIIPYWVCSLLEWDVLTRLKPSDWLDKAVSHFPFMSCPLFYTNWLSQQISVVRSSGFVWFISFLIFFVYYTTIIVIIMMEKLNLHNTFQNSVTQLLYRKKRNSLSHECPLSIFHPF